MYDIMVNLENPKPIWVLWRGKAKYAPRGDLYVNVRYRNGTYDYNIKAENFNWFFSDGTESHHEPEYDIVAYQFV